MNIGNDAEGFGVDSSGRAQAAVATTATPSSVTITSGMSKLDAMLAYRDAGMKPFMLSAGKVPLKNCAPCDEQHVTNEQREACECLTCHGFYAATDDTDRLREMARCNPRGLVAIRTGLPSGIVVVDIDTVNGHGVDGMATAARLREAGVLQRTAAQRSASGGWHLVYAHPGGRIRGGSNKLGPGVDIKADGAYFVVGPSRSPTTGTPYRWAGDTIPLPLAPLHPRIAAHLRDRPPSSSRPRPVALPQTGDRYVAAAVRGEVQRILDARGRGLGRNDELNRAAFILGTLVGAGVLPRHDAESALTQAAYSIGLDQDTNCNPRQIEATITSGINAGMRNPRHLQGVRACF
ncbi:bifunctional DNA primase/polymerase, partial [Sphaerisporangium siamense]